MKYSVTGSHVCKCLAGKEQQWLKTWIGGSAPGTLQLIQLPRKEVVPMHGTQNSDHIKHMFFRRLPQNMPIIVEEVPYQYSDIRSNGPSAPGIVYGNNSKRCPGFIYLHAKSSNVVVLWMPHDVINLVMVGITRYIYLPRDRIYLKVKIGQNSWRKRWDELPSVFNEK